MWSGNEPGGAYVSKNPATGFSATPVQPLFADVRTLTYGNGAWVYPPYSSGTSTAVVYYSNSAGSPSATLSLTNDTNLANLRVGDAVTETGGDGTGSITTIGATSLILASPSGTWSTGSTVTGPLIAAASGTFGSADSSTNSMTLSSSTGRWLITEATYEADKKLNKFVKGAGVATLPPGAPTSEPPGSEYTAVVNKDDDTVNKTSFPLTDTEISADKAYYSRVRYNSNDGTPVVSDYSEYNEFVTADSFAPTDWFATSATSASRSDFCGIRISKFTGVNAGIPVVAAIADDGSTSTQVMYFT